MGEKMYRRENIIDGQTVLTTKRTVGQKISATKHISEQNQTSVIKHIGGQKKCYHVTCCTTIHHVHVPFRYGTVPSVVQTKLLHTGRKSPQRSAT
jgi:hypothetical protein